MGHSWGAFSTMNIAALHTEISHAVAMCGFISVEIMIGTFFPGILKGYRRAVLELEKKSNPEFIKFNAVNTLRSAKTKALLIYSDDDKICSMLHYNTLKAELDGCENVKLLLVSGKGHNPNYTDDAVQYIAEFSKARAKIARNKKATKEDKAKFVASYDWRRMTEQDEKVWGEILKHLES